MKLDKFLEKIKADKCSRSEDIFIGSEDEELINIIDVEITSRGIVITPEYNIISKLCYECRKDNE